MKCELLAKLMPSSLDVSNYGSKSNDSITSEDILIKLSYSKLNDSELNFLLAKFLDDLNCRSSLYKDLLNKVIVLFKKEGENDLVCEGGNDLVCRYVDVAIMESIMVSCPFCNGTGFNIFNHSIDKCYHCSDGVFIYSDNVRADLIGVKKNKFLKKKYEKIMEELVELEQSALSKIGDK